MSHKLTDEQKIEVCKMYAEGCTTAEIARTIKESYSLILNINGQKAIVNSEWAKPFVKKFREDYIKRVKDVPVSNKRLRLDDLQYVRDKLIDQIKSNKCDTKIKKDELRKDTRSLCEVIASCRDEIEKKLNVIPGLGIIGDFEDKSDEQLISERDELIRQAEKSLAGRPGTVDSDSEGASGAGQAEPS